MMNVSKTGVIVSILVMTVAIVFIALHFLSDVLECDTPCISTFIFDKFCGKLITGSNETYHTFTRCELKCHAASNPERVFQKISEQGNTCAMLGYPERIYRWDEPNEFEFPYIKPSEVEDSPANQTV